MNKRKICYGVDEELYDYESVHDLLLVYDYLKIGDKIYEGVFEPVQPKEVLSASDLYDIIYDRLYDLVGEAAERFDITKSSMDKILKVIYKVFLDEGISNLWQPVNNSFREYIITENDMAGLK